MYFQRSFLRAEELISAQQAEYERLIARSRFLHIKEVQVRELNRHRQSLFLGGIHQCGEDLFHQSVWDIVMLRLPGQPTERFGRSVSLQK